MGKKKNNTAKEVHDFVLKGVNVKEMRDFVPRGVKETAENEMNKIAEKVINEKCRKSRRRTFVYMDFPVSNGKLICKRRDARKIHLVLGDNCWSDDPFSNDDNAWKALYHKAMDLVAGGFKAERTEEGNEFENLTVRRQDSLCLKTKEDKIEGEIKEEVLELKVKHMIKELNYIQEGMDQKLATYESRIKDLETYQIQLDKLLEEVNVKEKLLEREKLFEGRWNELLMKEKLLEGGRNDLQHREKLLEDVEERRLQAEAEATAAGEGGSSGSRRRQINLQTATTDLQKAEASGGNRRGLGGVVVGEVEHLDSSVKAINEMILELKTKEDALNLRATSVIEIQDAVEMLKISLVTRCAELDRREAEFSRFQQEKIEYLRTIEDQMKSSKREMDHKVAAYDSYYREVTAFYINLHKQLEDVHVKQRKLEEIRIHCCTGEPIPSSMEHVSTEGETTKEEALNLRAMSAIEIQDAVEMLKISLVTRCVELDRKKAEFSRFQQEKIEYLRTIED
ncbi:uncharacterized protein LOC124934802 [Impatiens glandulifera]|uniref:uncharacterized protein LOC124934802 n=1 Tax=Impatiens glandulifera TaxID=253017 RepID=UPI001FB0713F|nr:uncharacterized protein LOC124934802 [Impatiens glandulifera]